VKPRRNIPGCSVRAHTLTHTTHTRVLTHAHTRTHTRAHTRSHTRAHTRTHTLTLTHTRSCSHTRSRSRSHTVTLTHTRSRSRSHTIPGCSVHIRFDRSLIIGHFIAVQIARWGPVISTAQDVKHAHTHSCTRKASSANSHGPSPCPHAAKHAAAVQPVCVPHRLWHSRHGPRQAVHACMLCGIKPSILPYGMESWQEHTI
jgi:hypothetical protein